MSDKQIQTNENRQISFINDLKVVRSHKGFISLLTALRADLLVELGYLGDSEDINVFSNHLYKTRLTNTIRVIGLIGTSMPKAIPELKENDLSAELKFVKKLINKGYYTIRSKDTLYLCSVIYHSNTLDSTYSDKWKTILRHYTLPYINGGYIWWRASEFEAGDLLRMLILYGIKFRILNQINNETK